MIHFIT
jgi:hypothetical protein